MNFWALFVAYVSLRVKDRFWRVFDTLHYTTVNEVSVSLRLYSFQLISHLECDLYSPRYYHIVHRSARPPRRFSSILSIDKRPTMSKMVNNLLLHLQLHCPVYHTYALSLIWVQKVATTSGSHPESIFTRR
ncbi:hypothetical protein GYMLUDRAFT_551038 [Collybiopsis luxurians FD-317 M1]|uniref:Uncharacterized protein n=1 Tax=Collybiopsis luxurians FD-317 M1 TaxID=944289 RepID=A0A0D0CHJ2_9AGAR|nr:hypothetical protein GYMLUDRAFT_551038 [Collybiopsis luxurians FD-317 M1]